MIFKTLICVYTIFLIVQTQGISIPEKILKDIEVIKNTGNIPESLRNTVNNVDEIKDENEYNTVICDTCNRVIKSIIDHRRNGADKDVMQKYLAKLCYTFTDWGQTACDGYVQIEVDTILYIIDNQSELKEEKVCAIYLQEHNCQDPNAKKWTIDLPPAPTEDLVQIIEKRTTDSPLRILHLTDIHYDPLYEPGSNAVCDVPLCCEKINGKPNSTENAAGFWSDYRVCDMPWHSVTELMEHIQKNHDQFDLIYYTGDIISHRSWATSREDNTKSIKEIYGLLEKTFGNTKIYPILGNHESHPTDFYSPLNTSEEVTTKWIFDLVKNEWSKWLPDYTKSTISLGGFYTVLIKPGFRIVALNSNVCFTSNLWLFYRDEDPYDQLKWLVKVLSEAEKNHEKVHILSHIPPGEIKCYKQWNSQFIRIVNRFSTTIVAQFNGHTHLDEFRVFFDKDDPNKIVNVAFNGGSFTTFVGLNPNYRTYTVDPKNYEILDYNQYTYNLTEANESENKTPNWFKLYSFKDAYGMNSLDYEAFSELIYRMSKDKNLLQKYFKYQSRESPVQIANGCNNQCLAKLLCSITTVDTKKSIQCQELEKYFLEHQNHLHL